MSLTMNDLNGKAQVIQKMMADAAKETDPEKAAEWAQKLMAEGKALEEMGARYVQQERKRFGKGQIEVVLTPEQRKTVFQKTGQQIESLIIDDETGSMNATMPSHDPQHIEFLALQEGERRRAGAEADRMVRAELDRVLRDLENVGVAELMEQLEKLKQDPNFLGGLLHKKK